MTDTHLKQEVIRAQAKKARCESTWRVACTEEPRRQPLSCRAVRIPVSRRTKCFRPRGQEMLAAPAAEGAAREAAGSVAVHTAVARHSCQLLATAKPSQPSL